MAALLGNFLLPESDLQDLYKKLGLTKGENVSSILIYCQKTWKKSYCLSYMMINIFRVWEIHIWRPFSQRSEIIRNYFWWISQTLFCLQYLYFFQCVESNIKKLAEYVGTLPSPSNMDALVVAVFGSQDDKRASKFRQSVQYYLNGTASGFLKYCPPPSE